MRKFDLIYEAFLSYRTDHGVLPYHEKGWRHGLYLLRPYLPSAEAFEYGRKYPWSDRASWDDEEEAIVNSDFLYLNPPREAIPERMKPIFRCANLVILEPRAVFRGKRISVLAPGLDMALTVRTDAAPKGPYLGREIFYYSPTAVLGEVVVPPPADLLREY